MNPEKNVDGGLQLELQEDGGGSARARPGL